MTISGPAIITPPVVDANLSGPKVAGRFYGPMANGAPANLALGAANRLYATPMFINATSTITSLSFNVGTGIVGAWNARVGVYRDSGAGVPGALVSGSDTLTAVPGGSTTGVITGAINGGTGVVLGGNQWYWLAFVADTSGQSLSSFGAASGVSLTTGPLGMSTAASFFGGGTTTSVFVALAFGALPAAFGAASYNNNAVSPYLLAGF
jgi:hypothetical protein